LLGGCGFDFLLEFLKERKIGHIQAVIESASPRWAAQGSVLAFWIDKQEVIQGAGFGAGHRAAFCSLRVTRNADSSMGCRNSPCANNEDYIRITALQSEFVAARVSAATLANRTRLREAPSALCPVDAVRVDRVVPMLEHMTEE